jgi:hypothetical protein
LIFRLFCQGANSFGFGFSGFAQSFLMSDIGGYLLGFDFETSIRF